MSKILLHVDKQVSEIEEFTMFHCNIVGYVIGKSFEIESELTKQLISYEKKDRAFALIKAFRTRIIDQLEFVEDMSLKFLAIRDDGIYACFVPSKRVEKMLSTEEAAKRVSLVLVNSLHYYW